MALRPNGESASARRPLRARGRLVAKPAGPKPAIAVHRVDRIGPADGEEGVTSRFVFLSPRAPDFYVDWERAPTDTVAILRTAAGRDPHDRDLSDLVGELSTRSEEFRTRWAAHNVRIHRTAPRRSITRLVGDLSLTYEMMDLFRRQWSRPHGLHRRARLNVCRGTRPARELDRDDRGARRGQDPGENVVTIGASRSGSRDRSRRLLLWTAMKKGSPKRNPMSRTQLGGAALSRRAPAPNRGTPLCSRRASVTWRTPGRLPSRRRASRKRSAWSHRCT